MHASGVKSSSYLWKIYVLTPHRQEKASILNILRTSLQEEGPKFLFKGWTPAFMRLAPNTVLMFVFLEVSTPRYLALVISTLTTDIHAATQKAMGTEDTFTINAYSRQPRTVAR